jgi:pectate lyase
MGERRTKTWKVGGRTLLAAAAVLLATGVVPQAAIAEPDPPAFPGAEGFGAGATGGRGGSVYVVDTLEPFGEGSLGDALAPESCEPRTVVFAVSGVIEVPGVHDLELTCGDLTVAGQTAPGGGITVAGRIDGFGADPGGNIIMRHVRFRPPPLTDEEGLEDDLGHRYDSLQLGNNPNLMLDHLSLSWGSDETLDLHEAAGDATVQWTTIEQSNPAGLGDEGPHNDGMIAGPDSPRVTVSHSLFAHHEARCPAMATGPAELLNSVMYDCQDAFVHHNPAEGEFHIAGNTFIHGPSSEEHTPIYLDDEEPGDSTYWFSQNEFIDDLGFTGVVEGDISETDLAEPAFSTGTDPGQVITEPTDFATESEEYQPVTLQEDPAEAYDLVLAQSGAFPRDEMTLETIEDVETLGGDWEPNPPDDLFAGLEATDPPADEDADGMADEWEEENGLDPSDPDDHATEQEGGYTALEVYINGLADELVGVAPAAVEGGGDQGDDGGSADGGGDDAAASTSSGDDGTSPILYVILVVSVAALALAAFAVFTVLKRSKAGPGGGGGGPTSF